MITGLGDIVLDNKRYVIDMATWREKDIIDFAPRATVPGGAVVMSDLGLYQPLLQTNWQHGFGFQWYEDAQGYMTTTGNVDTRNDGLVMLFTKATSSDTNNNVKQGLCSFNGDIYMWGDAGLRKFSGGSWSSVYSTAAVNFAMNAGDYLFFCPDGLRILKMDTSGTITNAGLDDNSTDYRWLIIHNGSIYAGKDGTNKIHTDTNADLSQLEGTVADTDIIYCGIGNIPTLGAIVFAAQLYVARQDGLWLLGEDRIARQVINHSSEISSQNFSSMAVVNGYLFYPMRDKIKQWNGARVQDVTPRRISDTYPYVTYGQFDNFVAAGDFLLCTGRTNETVYTEALLCWDGVGWHKLSDLITNGTDSVSMMGYDVVNNYLWYHINATADVTYYIPFQARSPFPFASFPTTGTHSLITSRLDMGFRRIQKSTPSILIEARNCTATRYLNVYYQIDGNGTWILWDSIKQTGVIEIFNPGNFKTREYNYLTLRFDFITDSADQTPILEGYTLRFIMRPQVLYGYSFYIIASTEKQSGRDMDERSAKDVRRDLMDTRNSKSPVILTDFMGIDHVGYLTSIQGSPATRHSKEDGEPEDIEMRYLCNFASLEDEVDTSGI